MVENQIFISVKEICKTLSVSESKAYSIVRELNKELSDNENKYSPAFEMAIRKRRDAIGLLKESLLYRFECSDRFLVCLFMVE